MGRIILLLGPSGSGKRTIARELLLSSLKPRMVTTCITREARAGVDLEDEFHYVNPATMLRAVGIT